MYMSYQLCSSLQQFFYSALDAEAYSSSHFGQSSFTLPIVMDDMKCKSTEDHLVNCTFDAATGDCGPGEEAGVKCYPVGKLINKGEIEMKKLIE